MGKLQTCWRHRKLSWHKGKKVKADIALPGNPISELRDVTCHMGSHSVTCHPTQVNVPHQTPAMQAGTRFTYPGGMEGWVDLVDLIAPRPGVEPATFWSRVRRPTTAPPRQDNKSITSWQQVVVMTQNDTTGTTSDFCPRQLVTDLLLGSYGETGVMDFGLRSAVQQLTETSNMYTCQATNKKYHRCSYQTVSSCINLIQVIGWFCT